MSKTILEILISSDPDKPPIAQGSHVITSPQILSFRWSSSERAVSSGKWLVTNLPPSQIGAKILSSGSTGPPPAPGKHQIFTIDFTKFLPATPPTPPQVHTYYVQVTAIDSQRNSLGMPSASVSIIYKKGPASIQFDDLEGWQTLLMETYQALKGKFNMGEALSSFGAANGIRAYRLFASPDGPVSIEVHEAKKIYVSVPVKSPPGVGSNPIAYHWYEYQKDAYGKIVQPPQRDQDAPPDILPPRLEAAQNWCGNELFGMEEILDPLNAEPPHWSPVLVYNEGYLNRGSYYDIHDLMQKSQWKEAEELLNRHRKEAESKYEQSELSDRATYYWPPVRLQGRVKAAHYPSGDLAAHHTMDYMDDGDEAPTADASMPHAPGTDPVPQKISGTSQTEHPALDWDVYVIPDAPFNYTHSAANPGEMEIEIEQFAVPEPYRPQAGEWIQAGGRWVVDCGHSPFRTEIHPPEMLVSTRMIDPFTTEARVIFTGAWTGLPLGFVINPPARPTPTAVLKFEYRRANGSPGFDLLHGADLSFEKIPKSNPNHLQFKAIAKDIKERPVPTSEGFVMMTGKRRIQAMIRCWWEEPGGLTAKPAKIQGVLKTDSGIAAGAYLFYRDATVPKSTWKTTPVNADGSYLISAPTGTTLSIRPAGSGWNFKDVPRTVQITQSSIKLDFHAERASATTDSIQQLPGSIIRHFPSKKGFKPPKLEQVAPDSSSIPANHIRAMLLSIKEPTWNFGVKENSMEYPDSGSIYIRLAGLVDDKNQPVMNMESAYQILPSITIDHRAPKPPEIVVTAHEGPTVPGAKIRAKLILGNQATGYRTARQLEVSTDALGIVGFRIHTGSHVEEFVISIEVLENPFNPWFLPKVLAETHLVYPDHTGDDTPSRLHPSADYQLQLLSPLKAEQLADLLLSREETKRELLRDADENTRWFQEIIQLRQQGKLKEVRRRRMKSARRTIPPEAEIEAKQLLYIGQRER